MMRFVPIALVLAIAALVACDGSDGAGNDRIEAIRDARAAVEAPAEELGTAALTLADRSQRLTTIDEADLGSALDSLEEAVEDVEAAAGRAADVDVDRSVPDTAEAAAALQVAAGEAEEAAASARTIAEVLDRAQEIDEDLAELVDSWPSSGSRQELLDGYAAIAEDAETLAADIEQDTVDAACSAVLDLRVEAARAVAAGSRELRELVAGYRGADFEVREPELRADPYGVGGISMFEVSQQRDICPLLDVVAEQVTEVTEALARMQRALSPSDL